MFTFGQQATIVGTVTDPSGAVIPNVEVTIANRDTQVSHTFRTNDVGQYVAPDLAIGNYDLKAAASGFRVEETKGVVLNVNDRIRVNFQLKLGTAAETISVESNPISVQTDSSEQSSLINGTQISQLSTNGRSIYTYVTLTTGASNLMPDFQISTPNGAMGGISFNGNRPGHNLYLLDGGENSDRGGAGSSSVMPSIDAIAETQTLTSNYSSDYGLSSAGTISSAIKSGTRSFHASAWEFFRYDALDARNFFNPAPASVAELRYNVYGFNLGGPVTLGKPYNPERNKTFFFYNMEWRSIIQGQTLNVTVPSTNVYGGDFSGTGTTITVPSAAQVSPSIIAKNCPGGVLPAGVVQGQPFPGNVIPSCMLDPNAQALLHAGGKYGGIFPAPTSITPGSYDGQFIGGNNLPTNVREEIVRIDENVSDKFTIYGHFVAEQIAQQFGTTMWSADNVPTMYNTFGNPSYAAVLHTAYTISPTLVNEASFNYNGNRIQITPLGLFSAPSDFTFGRFFTGPNADNRIPTIQLTGSTGANYTVNWQPWNNTANSYQLRDDVSWTKGRHQLKIGGSWLYYAKVQDWFKNTQGGFTFDGAYTGNDFADFLLGYSNSYNEDGFKGVGHWNNVSWALYVEDNFRVNNKLTLNLGLRWDGIPHTYEANNQQVNFYPNLYNPANAAVLGPGNSTVSPTSPGLGPSPNPLFAGQQFYVNGTAFCGINGIPNGCVNGAWLNFQPRLGFAYDFTGRGKTVIRGGYAIMDERVQGNDMYNGAGNVPTSASFAANGVSLSNPALDVATGVPTPQSIPVSSLTGLNQSNYKAPRSTQFSIGIQQAIGSTNVLNLSYVGSQQRHQNYYTETNLVNPSLLPGLVCAGYTNPPPACGGIVSIPASQYNADAPYLGYHSIRMAENEANGDYNSLQVSIRGQALHNDLTYQAGYTYSHTNDPFQTGSSAGDLYSLSDPYAGWKYDFGPSPYDHRQIFFTNFVYQLPLLKHSQNRALKTTLGGWEISGIVTAESGAPLNISMSGNNVCSIIPSGGAPSCFNRPDINGAMRNPHTVNEWFDTSVFSTPASGTWGNLPNNDVLGPGRNNWNLSLFKNFVLNEDRGSNIQFRAEFFNVWNHTQFQGDDINGGVSTTFGSSNFGKVTSAYDPRTIQLALKASF